MDGLTLKELRAFKKDARTTAAQREVIDSVVAHFAEGVLYADLEGIPAFDEWDRARAEKTRARTRPGEHGIIDRAAGTITTLDDDGNEVVSVLPEHTADSIDRFDAHQATERAKVLGELGELAARARELQAEIDAIELRISPLIARARHELSIPLKDITDRTGYTHNQVYARLDAPQDEASQRARAGSRKNPSTYVTSGVGVGVAEASRILGISESGVRKRVAAGSLPHTFTDSGRLRILIED
ncbi:hypothetical protein [Microbacterium sp. UBA3486]|uniref:hypothetical protein n=1 Tax=Microbacterium TaxID=33882 RepID=UPI0025F4D8F5|nr:MULTISPECIES: hypothetical protein [Microbacterium]